MSVAFHPGAHVKTNDFALEVVWTSMSGPSMFVLLANSKVVKGSELRLVIGESFVKRGVSFELEARVRLLYGAMKQSLEIEDWEIAIRHVQRALEQFKQVEIYGILHSWCGFALLNIAERIETYGYIATRWQIYENMLPLFCSFDLPDRNDKVDSSMCLLIEEH